MIALPMTSNDPNPQSPLNWRRHSYLWNR